MPKIVAILRHWLKSLPGHLPWLGGPPAFRSRRGAIAGGVRVRTTAPAGVERRRSKRTGYLDPHAFARVAVGLGRREAQTRLHVFSVSDFHIASGGKWARLEGLVVAAVDHIIRRHVDPQRDLYTRLDADTACVLLPRATRQEAHARVTAIASDISGYLFGSAVVGGRRPQVVTANLPLAEIIGESGDRAIREAVQKAGAIHAAPDLGKAHQVTLATLIAEASPAAVEITEIRHAKAGEPAALSAEAKAGEVPAEIWVRQGGAAMGGGVAWSNDGTGSAPGAQAVSWGATQPRAQSRDGETPQEGDSGWLERHMAEGVDAASAAGRPMCPETLLTMVWTPSWVTSVGAVAAFHARVIRADPGMPPLEGGLAYRDAAPMEMLTLDRFVVAQAASELTDLHFGRKRVGLTVPVHWMSLAPRWCDCLRLPFERCPAQARRKLLKIEVFGLPADMEFDRLERLLAPLEKIGCDVMLRLPLSAADGTMPAASRLLKAVGVDLSELTEDQRVGDDLLFQRLQAFHVRARAARLAAYVWGVRRRQLVASLTQAGFSLVNGPGIMCDVSHPRPVR